MELKVLGFEKGTGLARLPRMESAEVRVRAEVHLPVNNSVGEHSLSRLWPFTPLVGARDRGIAGYHVTEGCRTAGMEIGRYLMW